MNFLILGDGPEELAWSQAVAEATGHRVLAAYPGAPGTPPSRDLEDALATSGIDAAIVGGPPEFRAEALRRVAAEGLPAICLHPPGPDSEAYYQVALSRAETGAILVPDLRVRLHPGVASLRAALEREDLGPFRGLRFEASVGPTADDLARRDFAHAVDVVRALLGDVAAVTATGDPPGDRPTESLIVQLRCAQSRRAEVRLWAGPPEPTRLILAGASGSLTLELPTDPASPARLLRRTHDGSESSTEFPGWSPRAALLAVLTDAMAGRAVHPDLIDGTRAMEVSEGVVRALRRGRTVELHYEEISESGTFKSVMTSLGCLILLATLFLLPIALAGPALGLGWTIYLAYVIPPLLVVFVVMQLFRFALRDPISEGPSSSSGDSSDKRLEY